MFIPLSTVEIHLDFQEYKSEMAHRPLYGLHPYRRKILERAMHTGCDQGISGPLQVQDYRIIYIPTTKG